jgi:hypothetical protein
MSVLHDVLTRMDRTLDSMIKQSVPFICAPIQDKVQKMTIFHNLCSSAPLSDEEIFKIVDRWLSNCENDEKKEFCQYIYDNILSLDENSPGQEYIDMYCKERGIELRK